MTAAVLPIVMILGHVLEERSLLGSREAIRALSRLAETSARRLRADGTMEVVPTTRLRAGDLIELRAGDRVPADGVIRERFRQPGHGLADRRIGAGRRRRRATPCWPARSTPTAGWRSPSPGSAPRPRWARSSP